MNGICKEYPDFLLNSALIKVAAQKKTLWMVCSMFLLFVPDSPISKRLFIDKAYIC